MNLRIELVNIVDNHKSELSKAIMKHFRERKSFSKDEMSSIKELTEYYGFLPDLLTDVLEDIDELHLYDTDDEEFFYDHGCFKLIEEK